MKKFIKFVAVILLLVLAFWLGTVATDKAHLSNGVLRLHVVAASDSDEDQALKLKVRDAINEELDSLMDEFSDMESAKNYLQEQLPMLERIANQTLKEAGSSHKATVSLMREPFPARKYDTFVLPAGIYEAVRVTIGAGEGRNWWCVVFPSLCVSATSDEFADAAAGAGFSDPLTGALTGREEYRVRFFILDCIGWVENWIYDKIT